MKVVKNILEMYELKVICPFPQSAVILYQNALHFYSRVRRMKKLLSAQFVMLEFIMKIRREKMI